MQGSLGKVLIAKGPISNGQTWAWAQVMEQKKMGRVRILRNQKKEYINEKRMSWGKLTSFDFLVWETLFPVLTVKVYYQRWRAEDRESSVLPPTFGRPCVCSGVRPSPTVAAGISYRSAEAGLPRGALSALQRCPHQHGRQGGCVFVFVFSFISTSSRGSGNEPKDSPSWISACYLALGSAFKDYHQKFQRETYIVCHKNSPFG